MTKRDKDIERAMQKMKVFCDNCRHYKREMGRGDRFSTYCKKTIIYVPTPYCWETRYEATIPEKNNNNDCEDFEEHFISRLFRRNKKWNKRP
jgi:hypothetical protein